MIDLHCHILPGCDDGPSDMDEALSMCRIAAEDGVRTIVASPHYDSLYAVEKREVLRRVEELRARLGEEGIDLRILPGSDAHLAPEIPDLIADGIVCTINDTGRYVLLELPSYSIPRQVGEIVFRLQAKGVRPVITHPERNALLQTKPEALAELVSRGALVQITAGSICGDFGPPARKAAEAYLRRGMAHIIASDAHSPLRRPPILSRGLAAAAAIVGRQHALRMVDAIPRAIIEGRPVDVPEPLPPRRSIFRALRAAKRGPAGGKAR